MLYGICESGIDGGMKLMTGVRMIENTNWNSDSHAFR
jgi:hypothetical protein